ncbi:hypothetical protein [Arthrobacter dokdonensis]|uniref:hypothetical protein n=1 Tax=Arthrobacter dokdonellae TaxID=2211210 RepID=UPI000DE5C1AF|nr:hypothetical protein [Arthrobacter dokdonellae]
MPGLALAAVLAGVVMLAYAGQPREFVTSDNLTLTGSGDLPDSLTFVDPWAIAGVVLLVAGLLVLAFTAGYRMGRRRRARRP